LPEKTCSEIFVREEMMGFWDSSGVGQTICTSLQTDNHANTSSLNFCGLDAFPDTNSAKALMAFFCCVVLCTTVCAQ